MVKSTSEGIFYHILPNGIRLVCRPDRHTHIVHAGVMFDLGSRDEQPGLEGVAHFWEHMAFKGTQNRSSLQIITHLDRLGGELNAYTTKEKVCFHASVLGKHTEKALDLLSDIVFCSVFPKKEIEKERQVIQEEMSMYYDSPDDAIQDDFDSLVFNGDPMGNNILGTKESLVAIQQQDLLDFLHKNSSNDQLVISLTGNISFEKAVRMAEKYFSASPFAGKRPVRKVVSPNGEHRQVVKKPVSQSHCVIGGRAYPLNDPRRLALFMVVNHLGGPAMNSRLNLSLREKKGWVYSVDAHFSPYSDTGLFSIYFGTDKHLLPKCEKEIMKELTLMKEQPLTQSQLRTIKNQLKGQLAMSEENKMGFMLMMAKSLLDLGYIESMTSVFEKIDVITVQDVLEVSRETFREDNIYSLVFEGE